MVRVYLYLYQFVVANMAAFPMGGPDKKSPGRSPSATSQSIKSATPHKLEPPEPAMPASSKVQSLLTARVHLNNTLSKLSVV